MVDLKRIEQSLADAGRGKDLTVKALRKEVISGSINIHSLHADPGNQRIAFFWLDGASKAYVCRGDGGVKLFKSANQEIERIKNGVFGP